MLLTASLQLQECQAQCQALGKHGLEIQPETRPRAAKAFCNVPMNLPLPTPPQNVTCIAGSSFKDGATTGTDPYLQVSSPIKGANVSHKAQCLKKMSLTDVTSMQVNT